MKLTLFQIDAFTNQLFSGNPAAICPLEEWLEEDKMQKIAAENNLAETAFLVKNGEQYDIRWFTPTVEVDLCGHATLAAAFVLYHHLGEESNEIVFYSHRSGQLRVAKDGSLLTLNFPVDQIHEIDFNWEQFKGLSIPAKEVLKGKTDYLFVYENESQVANMKPDFFEIAKLKARGIIITAPGDEVDFVSRFFGPQSGIDEDPVTGSAHTTLIPYWSKKKNKSQLEAKQLSPRGGELSCELVGDRVKISGECVLYMIGEIYV
ncbi:PhzF family phenazine biosynthesis protein [Cytophagaceae bacterium 50C-KIRBA]|uniref:PhzF family phenazine biosynthesis protein n=1 Tax=Aquirufa beregesia TaxID=2516556 RepID=A0ABX0EY47_9BACT|nr:PhzF family phenazine biosynthesis protein [Aquirufa beregesia]NGZ43664.1 PhzF family phenazine biosynthesis protein [Aquirufa beregesia]